MLHPFLNKFLLKLNTNCTYIHDELTNIDSVGSNRLIALLKIAHEQLPSVSYSLLFGMENGYFIGDSIFINVFVFGLSVGWKPVRKYACY